MSKTEFSFPRDHPLFKAGQMGHFDGFSLVCILSTNTRFRFLF